MKKIIILNKDNIKICPKCKTIYTKEDNFCSKCEELIELVDVEFE